ncbi:MAG TPA: hypothetical protein VGB22_09720 [candidate division Zixibacteria bacterium]
MASSVRADESGGQASAYLEWGVGARPVAMGGAYSAVADGPTGFWWNPGGLSQVRQPTIEAAMRTMSFDRQAGYGVLAYPFSREEAALALSWIYAGVGDLFEYNLDGVRGDQISDYANAVAFSFARRFTDEHNPLALSLGLNVRYVQHNIAGIDAFSVGFDLGTHVRYRLRGRYVDVEGDNPPEVMFGLSVQRINQKFPWTTSDYWVPRGEGGASFEESFPFLVRGGTAARFMQGRGLVAFDLSVDEKQGAEWHVGAEGQPHPLVAIRAGLDNGDPTFGGGLRPKINKRWELIFDYAFAIQPDAIDAEHIFSVGARF